MVATPEKLTQQSPIDRFIPLLKGCKSYTKRDGSAKNYTASCPAHNDGKASLMVWEETDGHVGIKCWAGCSRKAICDSLSIAEADLYVKDGKFEPRRQTQKIGLIDVARDKWIHPHLLIKEGLQEDYTWIKSDEKKVYGTLKIPYYTMDGSEYSRNRIRTALVAKNGSWWEGNGSIIPYGLHRLPQNNNPLITPEGETDALTLWQWGFHALGIPGAESTNCLQSEHVAAFPPEVYMIKEPPSVPGKPDAGKKFIENMIARLAELGYQGRVHIIDLQASHGVKDPNALNQKLFAEDRPRDFKAEFQKALDAATLVDIYAAKEAVATKFDEIQGKVMDAIEKQDPNATYDLAEDIIELDIKEQARIITDIKAGLKGCKEFSWRTLKDLLREAQKEKKKQFHTERVRVSGKAQIVLGKQLSEETDEALDALYKANIPPVVFVQDGKLVRIYTNERGETGIEHYTEDSLLNRLSRVAEFYTYNEGSDSFSHTHPSAKLARQILAQGSWKFPAIEGIIETPAIRPDGTILDTPGYDAQTKLYYIPQKGFQNCKIPNNPTKQDIESAIGTLEDLIADFCFAEEENSTEQVNPNKANAIGLMITPGLRPAIKRVSGSHRIRLLSC